MQNLTVEPFEDKYRILIGHRRHAAAKEAGLTELPCVIVDIPEDKQIEIMLIENMQRSDLTVLEEAQGLQLMMDMGNSIGKICEKTGFSEYKVRHRIKMRELDQDVLKERFDECQNISIMDLQKLEQIKDPELRNDTLKYIGTANFESKVRGAVAEEEFREWRAKVLEAMGDAEKIVNTAGKEYFGYVRKWDNNADEVLEKVKGLGCKVYYTEGYQSFSFYTDKTAEDQEEQAEKEIREAAERELRSRKDAIREILKRMMSLRKDFVKGFFNKECGYYIGHNQDVMKLLVKMGRRSNTDDRALLEMLGVEVAESIKSWESEKWDKLFDENIDNSNVKQAVLFALYLHEESGGCETPYDMEGKFFGSAYLRRVYDFMKLVGYQMSDEEKQIMNGTHELYVKEDEDEQE